MRRLRLVAAVLVLLGAASTLPSRADPTEPPSSPVELIVDPSTVLAPINRDLIGFGWHAGGAPLSAVAPLQPHLVRVDASLQDVSRGPNEPLQLDTLLAQVADIRAIGGEPLVILSYVPAWMGSPNSHGRDPTRVKPADLDAWEALVHDVVHALATAPAPALRFEAWNEPDVPLFWQDTPMAWVDTAERSARAVARVEAETELDLAFGGPATAFPDPVFLAAFLARFRDPSLPLDFVSWHYYGNYPFFGPDGAEFAVTEPIQPVVGQRNPIGSPSSYGIQIPMMRAWTEAALAGSERTVPDLVLDEWNLSAAGYDLRHDTAEGAAFAAGVLADMQASGLDAAAFFRASETRGVPGEHGAVRVDGSRKPVWWVFDLWQTLAPNQVALEGIAPLDQVWAVASTDDCGRTTVLLASFDAGPVPRPRTVAIRSARGADPWSTASIRRIDADHVEPTAVEGLPVVDGGVVLELPTPGVAFVELQMSGCGV